MIGLDLRDGLDDVAAVTVCGVDDDGVDVTLDQRCRTLNGVGPSADRSGDQQPTLGVLGCVRELNALLDVLHGDEAHQPEVVVHDRQFLDAVSCQDDLCLVKRDRCLSCHQSLRGHHLVDRAAPVGLESQVAVCEDADEPTCEVGDRHTADLEAGHQVLGL